LGNRAEERFWGQDTLSQVADHPNKIEPEVYNTSRSPVKKTTAENQSDSDSVSNSDIPRDISFVSVRVGGALANRGVVSPHKPRGNLKEQGIVIVLVCVDRDGNIIAANFTQVGSTTASPELKNIAVSSAKRWKFAPGEVDKHCGTITYNF
jgi:outer membrane biosynthesis protein TonB